MTSAQLRRLETITERLRAGENCLALLGLGSTGQDVHRMDEHSDLDFFVIVAGGTKQAYLSDLGWLDAEPRWVHRNTADGFQVLTSDGVFCEFAVFEPDELGDIPFEPGRVLWSRAGFDLSLLTPSPQQPTDREWLADQVLANLYIGLHRYLRGELLAAVRLIQGEALENLLRMVGTDDPFNPSRRAERLGLPLADMATGYAGVPESAEALFLSLPALARSSALGLEISLLLDRCRPVNPGLNRGQPGRE